MKSSSRPYLVLLAGEGRLWQACKGEIEALDTVELQIEPGCNPLPAKCADLLVAAFDRPRIDLLKKIGQDALQRGSAFLPAWIEFGEGRAGPFCLPDAAGCLACAERRRLAVHPRKRDYAQILQSPQLNGSPNPWAIPFPIELMALFVRDEVERAAWGEAALTANRIYLLNLSDLESGLHAFLPVPDCPVCGSLLRDSPDAARFDLGRPHAVRQGAWRVCDAAALFEDLRNQCVDPRFGMATQVGNDISTPLCAVGSARFYLLEEEREEWSAGLTLASRRSRAVAILEALERHAGLRPCARKTAVRGAYKDLSGDAIDPRALILYSEEQYRIQGFPCIPFRDDLELTWVWGHSFRQQRPLLVPEQAVYYDIAHYPKDRLFVVECSNGCAIGGCLAEAIFYGLLEAVERDAALRTWYRRAPARLIDPESLPSRNLLLQIDRLQQVCGYDLHILDVTQEFGIPSIWLMAVNLGDKDHRSLSASKAHPDPLLAISGALGEISGTLSYHRSQCIERREDLLRMMHDSRRVIDRLDHSMLGGLPETFDRLGFLLEDRCRPQALSQAFPTQDCPATDMAAAASWAVERVLEHGFDVIAVDQTPPEQHALGLSTAKVLVPGLLPMTYCTFMRRTDRKRLGDGPLNLHPHPFA